MKVYLFQQDIIWHDRQANYVHIQEMLTKTQPEPNSLLILPEMFDIGFSMNTETTAQEATLPSEQALKGFTEQFQIDIIAGTVTQMIDHRPANEAVWISSKGEIKLRYQKMHGFSPSGEDQVYHPGQTIQVLDFQEFCICPFICYDLRFPEVFREALGHGVNLFIVIANWPAKRRNHWIKLLQARAIENQAFVIGVNRVGKDPNVDYAGDSLIVDPKGEILIHLKEKEQILAYDLDPKIVDQWRSQFPAIKDRKI
ncbi:MAG: carbon-nitrogen family hydrolase [Lentisphaeria bacterium]|nr:carbon-nitrogen family hydrolase [Lentisphaeria bacterium]